MSDVIRLLPDSIANQIAAGEVIQRPASVVKELIENAIDAGADDIQVIIRDAGKTLIQVVDNGMGMSAPDARMSFERHATSKISTADDLFAIHSMGFRGEALSSIAAIAHVEMRTRREEHTVGTDLYIEGSEVKRQEPCQTPVGTYIAVKNLFYNVPARRKFLKSDTVEYRHILDECVRLALAHPELAFSLHHNDREVFRLPKSNQRQRVVGVLGKRCNEYLVPVSEETSYVGISGFAGKPDYAKKSRGDQFLFVNRRFIKSPYLYHAIRSAFEDMIAPEAHPFYVLFLTIDPERIDINVHPTKQQIKFEDERLIYNYLRVAVRHALGKYSVTPTLDFEQETAFGSSGSRKPAGQAGTSGRDTPQKQDWERLFEGMHDAHGESQADTVTLQSKVFHGTPDSPEDREPASVPYQLHKSLLVTQIKSGLLVVDQQTAHERILYERCMASLTTGKRHTQKALFPVTLELNSADSAILKEILEEINALGFDIQEFGGDTFVVHGSPAEVGEVNEEEVVRAMLTQYKEDLELSLGINERISRAVSLSTARKRGKFIPPEERQLLIDMLFACENPYTGPTGRKCFLILELDELFRRLNRDSAAGT